jgi:hypothetical protein
MNRKQREEAAQAALNNARDWGRDFHHMWPEKNLIEVCREGSERFEDKGQVMAFLEGYVEARRQRDEYLKEFKEATQ